MSNQKKAADAAASAHARLSAEMRRIKEVSQLSFGGLADRTHYSRSSWERFLNGKQLPTTVAVEQLAAVAGTDPEPLLGLLAEATAVPAGGTAPTAPAPAAAPVEEPGTAARPKTAQPVRTVTAEPAERSAATDAGGSPRRSTWRRRSAVIGYIAAGALMGSVATGVVLPLVTDAAHGADTSAGGTRGAGADDEGTDLVPGAGDIQVKCTSDTCIRNDPQAMECQWDAETVKSTFLRGMHIQLRYSAACQAVWGRIEGGAVGDKVTIRDARGNELEALIRFEHDSYTKMLAVSEEAPLASMSVCGVIPKEKQRQCAPEGAVQLP
ncbi:helix-turn-helix domain-containing protein [Streptomyces sp. NPDC001515]